MKRKSNSSTTREAQSMSVARTPVICSAVILAIAGLAYLHFSRDRNDRPSVPETTVAEAKPESSQVRKQSQLPQRELRPTPATNHARPAEATPAAEPPDPNKVRQWVSSLVALELKNGTISVEQATTWKQNLQQLISAGPQALPAIRE